MTINEALEVLIGTLVNKSGGGVKSSISETLAGLKPEVYNALSIILHELGLCGGEGA